MYGARDYLAYLGYGAMRLFQDEILRGHGNFWSRKKNLPVPYCHEYCTVPYHPCQPQSLTRSPPYLYAWVNVSHLDFAGALNTMNNK